jgi:pyrrolysine biosynthesis protein PylC
MLVAVVGGNLQGVEATYLSRKAGWEVRVIDKEVNIPALGLCDSFVQLDVTAKEELGRALRDVDLVIPALEDDDALSSLSRWTKAASVPFAFDPAAYSISSSKVRSDRLFAQMGVSAPKPWPECGFPVVVKPSRGSGSRGILRLHDLDELKRRFSVLVPSEEWVLQEFVYGPSYSLEVTGFPGQYTVLQVTELEMDVNYDCKRVLAPTDLSAELVADFGYTSIAIAEALGLRGVMDVEMILHNGVIKVLEIDARLPSQTPTVVYWSTGLNIVRILGELFLNLLKTKQNRIDFPRGIVYEHIRVSSDLLEVAGEHIMTGIGPLHVCRDFFGADEAITNYAPGRDEWVATLIISGIDRQEAWARRSEVIEEIRKRFRLGAYSDQTPKNFS